MRSLKEMLQGMSDRVVSKLAAEVWESYEDDGEDGIARELDVSPEEAAKMLDSYIPMFHDELVIEFKSSENLADAMRVYRDGGSRAAILKAQLRELKAQEAAVKAELKELEDAESEETESFDPYKVYVEEGEEVLKEKLETLDIKGLRQIIKNHGFDRAHRSTKWTEDRLVELISSMTASRARRGECFRNFRD